MRRCDCGERRSASSRARKARRPSLPPARQPRAHRARRCSTRCSRRSRWRCHWAACWRPAQAEAPLSRSCQRAGGSPRMRENCKAVAFDGPPAPVQVNTAGLLHVFSAVPDTSGVPVPLGVPQSTAFSGSGTLLGPNF